MRNSKGPSTDLCGTPWVTSILSETVSLTIVCWILLVRYDSNQLSVTPLTPHGNSLLSSAFLISSVMLINA